MGLLLIHVTYVGIFVGKKNGNIFIRPATKRDVVKGPESACV